jgi:hypothetical protein
MDLSEKERVEKAALRKRRQQGVAAGTSRFAELEQAVQEIRMNTLQVRSLISLISHTALH